MIYIKTDSKVALVNQLYVYKKGDSIHITDEQSGFYTCIDFKNANADSYNVKRDKLSEFYDYITKQLSIIAVSSAAHICIEYSRSKFGGKESS